MEIDNRILAALKKKLMLDFDALQGVIREEVKSNKETMLEEIKLVGKAMCKDFVIDQNNRFLFENLALWLLGEPFKCVNPKTGEVVDGDVGKGLYIAGKTGTGKTLAVKTINYLAKAHNARYSAQRPHILLPLSWKDYRADEITQLVLQDGSVLGFNSFDNGNNSLCIQDLGSEPQEVLYMGNRIDPLRMLIESRGDLEGRLLVVTSNLPMCHELTFKRYGDRAVSRLNKMCNYFVLGGDDRRK